MSIRKQWSFKGVNDWVDSNLLDSSPYYLNLRGLVDRGELEQAYELVKHIDKKDVDSFRVASLRNAVSRAYEQVCDWQTKGDKTLTVAEPDDWYDIPRFDEVGQLVHDVLLHTHNSASILDVGCYTGYFSRNLAQVLANPKHITYHACDVQEPLIEYMRIKYNAFVQASQAVQYFVHNAEHLHSRRYDVITMLEVLTHTLDPVVALDSSLDALKSGGTLVVTTTSPTNERCPDRERLRTFTEDALHELILARACRATESNKHNLCDVKVITKTIIDQYKQPEVVAWTRKL